jgi:hypothetical protein
MAKADTAAADTSTTEDADFENADDNVGFEDVEDNAPDKGAAADDKSETEDDSAATDDSEDTGSDSEEDAESDEDSTDEGDSSAEEVKETTTEEENTDDSKSDEKTGDTSTLSPEEQKRHNDEMAQARIREREAKTRADKAEADAQEATIERYLREAGEDETELERRKLNVDAWRINQEKIVVNRDRLSAGIEKAVANIPLFRSGSKEIQEELAASLDDFERMYVVKDDKGRPTQVLGDVYTFLQNKATSIQRIQATGATQQQRDKSKQQSRTITAPKRAPKKAKVDEGIAAFEAEAARY